MATIKDLVIKFSGNGEELRRDLKQDQKAVNDFYKKVNDMKNSLINIHVEDEKAKEEIDGIKRRMEAIRKLTAKVDIDTEEGKAKLEELRVYTAGLKDKIIDIKVDDAEAIFAINNLKAELDSLHGKTVDEKVNQQGGGPQGKTAPWGTGALVGSILSALPLLSPLTATATGGVLALASAFGAAGAGAVGFGAIAVPTLKQVFDATSNLQKAQQKYDQATTAKQRTAALLQEKQAMDGLTGAQKEASKELVSFESFWSKFAKSFQSPVLNLFSQSLKALQTLLTDMKPAINGAALAFQGLMGMFRQSLGTPPVKQFFDYLGKDAGPSIFMLGQIFGNVMKGIMNLLVAFGPLGQQMMRALVNMSQQFATWSANWTKSKGFQQFINYVKTEGPVVMSVLGNLIKAIINILIAMAPLGAALLNVVNGFSKWLANFTKLHPAITQAAMAIAGLIGGLLLLRAPLSFLFNFGKIAEMVVAFSKALIGLNRAENLAAAGEALMDALNPIGWIILVIAAVAALVVAIVTHWNQIVKFTENLWNGIAHFFSKWGKVVYNYVNSAIHKLAQSLSKFWKSIEKDAISIWNSIIKFIEKLWNGLAKGATKLWKDIEKVWNNIVKGAQKAWSSLVKTVQNLWKDFVKWIENAAMSLARGVVNAFKWLYNHNYYFKDLVDGIKKLWTTAQHDAEAVWHAITSTLSHLWNGLKHLASSVWHSMVSFISHQWNWGKSITESVWHAISSFLSSLWHSIEHIAASVWHSIVNSIVHQWHWFRSITSSVWHAISSFLSSIWHSIVHGAESIWRPIANFFSHLWNGIRNRISSAWHGIRSALSSAAHGAINAVKHVFSGLWNMAHHWGSNMIHGFISGIEGMAGGVVRAARGVMGSIGRFLGFHSPAEEGEGRHIVEWGENMIHGFVDGINKAAPHLRSAMSNVIQAPELALSPNVAQMINHKLNGATGSRGNIQVTNHFHLNNPVMNNQDDVNRLSETLARYEQKKLQSVGMGG